MKFTIFDFPNACREFQLQYFQHMDTATPPALTRREREVMGVIHQLGKASASEVREALSDQPKYSAVRAVLTVLEEKGHLKHTRRSRKFVYESTVSPQRAKRSALRNLLSTFYEGSPEKLVAALLNPEEEQLTGSEIERIKALLANHNEDTDEATSR